MRIMPVGWLSASPSRRWLLGLCLVVASTAAAASSKKGIGIPDDDDPARLEALDVAWYYTWSACPLPGHDDSRFVPMVWGGRRADADLERLAAQGRKYPALLAVNEPDHGHQANMSVQEVLKLWPRLSGLADRLGSPAMARNLRGGWFDEFWARVRASQLKLDFIAVHAYGNDPAAVLRQIDEVHARYGKPLWITEMALADWKALDGHPNRYAPADALRFMRTVLAELERRPFVERYAWFGAGRGAAQRPAVRPSALFDEQGRLNELGKYYANFDAPAAP